MKKKINWNKFLEKNQIDIELSYQYDWRQSGKSSISKILSVEFEPKIPVKAVIKHLSKKQNRNNFLVTKDSECSLNLEKSLWETPCRIGHEADRGESHGRSTHPFPHLHHREEPAKTHKLALSILLNYFVLQSCLHITYIIIFN